MRKVDLRMNELTKYNVIKKLVEQNSSKKNAAIKLGLTLRSINRLINVYKEQGKEGFVHKNRYKKPACAFDFEIKNKIINLYLNEYSDTNITHFVEIIKKDLDISISDSTLINWLKEKNTLSPKATRHSKRKMKNSLKKLKLSAKSKKDINYIQEAIGLIDSKDAHPRRARCKYEGEMIQMDASSLEWLPGITWHLHVAIDDASGNIVGAYFDTQETLKAYYNVFNQILTNYGIPAMFYTDKRTVFEYKRKDTLMSDEDTFTQFSYACHQLGVEIKTTSVAQAKGRVERLNQTLQSRLPVELRRADITSIEQANEFLNHYVKEFNKQFALQLNNTNNVYDMQPNTEQINNILAVLDNRVIDNGHSIKYKNDYYIPIDKNKKHKYFQSKTKCMVIEAFDGNLYLSIKDQIYGLDKIDKHEKISKEFDTQTKSIEEINKSKAHIPPMSHPWKQSSFNRHLQSQKHRQNLGANV